MEYRFADKMDWQEYFKMLKRWYYRIRDNVDDNKEDFYFVFFVFCHQFKDWLVTDGVATDKEVDTYINQNVALRLCADVCNFTKHARLNSSRTGDSKTNAVGQKYNAMTSGESSYVDSTLKIESGGKVIYDAFQLVSDCMDAWGQFLISKSLPIPETLKEWMAPAFKRPREKWKPSDPPKKYPRMCPEGE